MYLSKAPGVVFFLVLAGCAGHNASTLSSSQRAQIAQIDAALKLVADRRFDEAESVIQPLIHARHFGRIPSAEQYRALRTAARLAFTLKQPKLEYESRVRLLALPEATPEDRVSRVNAAFRLGDIRQVIIGFTDLVERNPEWLSASTEQFVVRALRDANTKLPHGSAFPLLLALYGAHWEIKWYQEPSFAWQELALLLLERNRVAEAIDVSTHVTDPYAIISMRADRRFDAVLRTNRAHFDVSAALKRESDRLQDAVERTPKSLTPRIVVMVLLIEQQHHAAALAAADGVIAEIRSKADPKQWYDDFDDQYASLLDARSQALRHLGRWDEGLEQLVAASWVVNESGENVSQVINLGALYCDLGKPKDALGSLVRLGVGTSPYGSMQEAAVRLDAAIQLSDGDQAEKWIGFLKEHRADAPQAYQDALLQTGDFATAAKWLIERLEDRDQRSEALLSVQDYAVPQLTSRQAELDRRTRELIARPDVQGEIRKVGRTEKYALEAQGQ
jgi:tetratricopeptide (TPR) repeat protein